MVQEHVLVVGEKERRRKGREGGREGGREEHVWSTYMYVCLWSILTTAATHIHK